jgi:DnaA-like protein
MASVDADVLAPELRGSLGPAAGLMNPLAPQHRASLQRIVALAAFGFDVDPKVLLGPSRTRPVVHWRQITLAAARLVGYSYPAIATYVGCDHSTVIHAVRRVESQPAWAEAAARIVAWANTVRDDEQEFQVRSVVMAPGADAFSQRGDDELAMRRRAAAAEAAYPSQGRLGQGWAVGTSKSTPR